MKAVAFKLIAGLLSSDARGAVKHETLLRILVDQPGRYLAQGYIDGLWKVSGAELFGRSHIDNPGALLYELPTMFIGPGAGEFR